MQFIESVLCTGFLFFQIDLPDSVCRRQGHSLSSFTVKTNTVWLIITGGQGPTFSSIKGSDVTSIVEIG